MGTYTWFNGAANHVDRQKVSYKRWMNQFRDQREIEEEFNQNKDSTKQLLEKLNKRTK